MNVKINEKWEQMNVDPDWAYQTTRRLKVIGGWLVETSGTTPVSSVSEINVAVTFIPDPNHEWEIK